MALPIRTTLSDVDGLCGYLITKPTGATSAEARAVLDEKILDGRKISALKYWNLIEEHGSKMRLTDRGRLAVKDKGARRADALREVVAAITPYAAAIERAVHRKEVSLAATDVAAHWHQHFKAEAGSDSDKILNDQAVCFFQIAEGADLGRLVIGRKGQPTRLQLDEANARRFVHESSSSDTRASFEVDASHAEPPEARGDEDAIPSVLSGTREGENSRRGNRVFITHGKNRKILDQVKELVAYGKFEPIVAQERETAAKPVPEKVMDDMRGCQAAVIHVGAEGVLFEKDGKERPQVNGNVLIEIGAAMALYGRSFILLVEEGVQLPSNLQGLYECRYTGDELNMPAAMKLLKGLSNFE
jgi:hypothetical protein